MRIIDMRQANEGEKKHYLAYNPNTGRIHKGEVEAGNVLKTGMPILEEADNEAEQAKRIAEVAPEWRTGQAYDSRNMVVHKGQLYEVIQAHTSQSDWPPDKVPALSRATVPEGVIPEWRQPAGAHDAYNIGDKVLFQGQVYESLIDANVWSPAVYPAGWELVE